MTNAERRKVRNDRGRLRESEVAIELQAISRARYGRAKFHDFRNHITDQGGSVSRASTSAPASSVV